MLNNVRLLPLSSCFDIYLWNSSYARISPEELSEQILLESYPLVIAQLSMKLADDKGTLVIKRETLLPGFRIIDIDDWNFVLFSCNLLISLQGVIDYLIKCAIPRRLTHTHEVKIVGKEIVWNQKPR